MRITIIGVGAMGSLFAGRLSSLADITMLGSWEAQINALNANGLRLIHPDGRESQHQLRATADSKAIPPAGLVLIMVKSPSTAAAAQRAAEILSPGGLAITIQNGLGNLETVAQIVGAKRAAQGVTSEGAAMLGPGVARHAGASQTYLASNLAGMKPADSMRIGRLQEVVALFNEAGFETQLVESADSLIWGKLAVNAGINPLTALLQVPNGFLLENEDARWIMQQAAAEVAQVAEALAIPLPYPNAAERAERVAQDTAANRSSMAQDVARGAPTEIEAICGAVVRHGARLGLSTPVNRALQELILRQTAVGQWQDALEGQPLEIRQRLKKVLNNRSVIM